MESKSSVCSKLLRVQIPHARMKYPDSSLNKIKYIFWYVYTPFHPIGRNALLKLHFLRHEEIQPFLIGKIDIEKSLEAVVDLLLKEGYGNHFVAWEDNGELLSLRRVEDFIHQYHIRIFENGEVRGHYEYTPECHPVRHMKKVGMENRRDDFLKIIGKYIV